MRGGAGAQPPPASFFAALARPLGPHVGKRWLNAAFAPRLCFAATQCLRGWVPSHSAAIFLQPVCAVARCGGCHGFLQLGFASRARATNLGKGHCGDLVQRQRGLLRCRCQDSSEMRPAFRPSSHGQTLGRRSLSAEPRQQPMQRAFAKSSRRGGRAPARARWRYPSARS